MGKTVYFDNAATSFPKPQSVIAETVRCMKSYCGNAGRGAHPLAMAASKKIYECREALAEFLGMKDVENIIFTMNTTYALNTVIKGILKKGDHVLISDMEHNSVYRPIYKLAKQGIVEYDMFSSMALDPGRTPQRICADILSKIRPNTRMVVCVHSSNICSVELPIADIATLCRRYGIIFVVDAAQSAGHSRIDMGQMNIDIVCLPGHKGLYGPQGTGAIAINCDRVMETLAEGGNGINSLDGEMPEFLPERHEAGTLSTQGIAGLLEGIRFVNSIGIDEIRAVEQRLFLSLREGLLNIPGVKLYAKDDVGSVLLFNLEGVAPDRLSEKLSEMGFCTRSGYHCAPLAHKTLGTIDSGAVRVGFGIYNTEKEVDKLIVALNKIKNG